MAALHPRPGGERDPEGRVAEGDGGDGAREPPSDAGAAEEEVQVALAVERSMDGAWREERELARATALSLRSYSRERERERAEDDAGLLAALEASLEEALPSADEARADGVRPSEREAAAAAL
ncbi:hypothetical protein DUI87_00184 [Hirundo rustica rustica]|uniref:Uncharacterized protein n=1 Tax=Hirundo rustica rustica TaxID=333673 RepID=A0A3M0LBZ9_HIRRU|nr:hypothetical protein DUI87_00184 [Hirundo rustica rustica]